MTATFHVECNPTFRCTPLAATMTISTCLNRQKRAAADPKAGHQWGYRGSRLHPSNFSMCLDCELGKKNAEGGR